MLARLRQFFRPQPEASANESVLLNRSRGPYCSMDALLALRWTAHTLKINRTRSALRQEAGPHQSRFRGRGMEFAEVRPYQPGDDVRNIDWRVTARRQKPHTKLFNEERERPVFIVCDQSLSQFFGSRTSFKSVRAAEAAALIAWTALDHGDRVGGLVFAENGHHAYKPARSRKKLLQVLQGISDYNQSLHIGMALPESSFGLAKALLETERLIRPGTLLVVISDFQDCNTDCEDALRRLSRHNEMLWVRTADMLEERLPGNGFYPVSDGEETLVLETSQADRQRYEALASHEHASLQALSQRLRAAFASVYTHQAPAAALQQTLRSIRS